MESQSSISNFARSFLLDISFTLLFSIYILSAFGIRRSKLNSSLRAFIVPLFLIVFTISRISFQSLVQLSPSSPLRIAVLTLSKAMSSVLTGIQGSSLGSGQYRFETIVINCSISRDQDRRDSGQYGSDCRGSDYRESLLSRSFVQVDFLFLKLYIGCASAFSL